MAEERVAAAPGWERWAVVATEVAATVVAMGVLVAVAGTEQNHRRRGCSAKVAFLNQGRL